MTPKLVTEHMHVYLEVTDTGCGMNKETLNRIYDPFFSTKFTGRGLASVGPCASSEQGVIL